MALVLATDVFLGSADSYTSISEADTYHGKLQNDDWFLIDTATKESLLMRSSIIIDARYARRWKTPEVAYVSAPLVLKRATAELALFGASNEIPRTQERGIKSVAVGPIRVEFDPSTEAIVPGDGTIWDYMDFLLSPIIVASSGTSGFTWGMMSVTRT